MFQLHPFLPNALSILCSPGQRDGGHHCGVPYSPATAFRRRRRQPKSRQFRIGAVALRSNPRKLLTRRLRLRLDGPALEAYTSGATAGVACGSSRAASGRTARLPLTPNAVIRRFTNSFVTDAAGGFVSVLIGLCGFATFFLCCLPSIGPVERCGEGDIGDAIALDCRKDRIDRRR
jgi:hypothetical protein